MGKKGNYFIAKSENLCKFAVQYSFGILRPYILAQSQSESPPRHKNELKIIIRECVPYGADFLVGLLWLVVSQDCV